MKNSISFDRFLGLEKDKFFQFFEKTKIKLFPKVNAKHIPESWIKVHFKEYPRLESIKSARKLKINTSIIKTLKSRKSSRENNKIGITKTELATLLYYSTGLNGKYRFYPSAGARYPLELYFYAGKVNGLEKGIYHYNIKRDSFEIILKGSFEKKLKRLTGEKWIAESPVLIFLSAVFRRTTTKYNLRGYRFVLIEAGHLAQNVYLLSAAMSLKCCGVGGFLDDETSSLLDLIPGNESVIYLIALGK